jgi:hypothetical protein
MPAKQTLTTTFELVQKFVDKQKGVWAHADWEAFLADASALGYDLTDETRRHLGNVLEAAKHFYTTIAPGGGKASEVAPEKAPAKPKAKAKAAATPKAKPAAKPKAAPKKKAT